MNDIFWLTRGYYFEDDVKLEQEKSDVLKPLSRTC